MKKGTTGFTIVELLIVIVAIAILAAISVAAYGGMQQRARDSQRKADVAQITKGLKLWSIETGSQFSQMNSGNSSSANGWFDYDYGGGSVQGILQTGKYIGSNVNDPKRKSSEASRWRYMIVPCTSDVSDNRRVVMVELESAPAETVAQQVSPWGCSHTQIGTYASMYFMNYVGMADAR